MSFKTEETDDSTDLMKALFDILTGKGNRRPVLKTRKVTRQPIKMSKKNTTPVEKEKISNKFSTWSQWKGRTTY